MQELTQEYLQSVINYDKETGIFTWKERDICEFYSIQTYAMWSKKCLNKPAGHLNIRGYLRITLNGKSRTLHRLAWLYTYGYMPINYIDHINGVKTDNRICNLREATNSENCQNIKKCQSNNKSTGLLGVCFRKRENKFQSYICINGKNRSLGYFNTAIEAHNVYLKAKRKLHPFGML